MNPNHEDWSTYVYYEYKSDMTCDDFLMSNFCTSDGEVGANWPDASFSWKTDDMYWTQADADGAVFHPGHCPQCGAVDCSEPAPAGNNVIFKTVFNLY